MNTLIVPIKRHPVVPLRAVPLTEELHDYQVKHGQFVVDRGERFAIASDSPKEPGRLLGLTMWEKDDEGRIYRPGARFTSFVGDPEDRGLFPVDIAAMAAVEAVIPGFEARFKKAHIGFDSHFSLTGDLYARHFHAGWANPFSGELEEPLDNSFQTLVSTHWFEHECRLGTRCPAKTWANAFDALVALSTVRGWTEDLGWLSGGKVTVAFRGEIIDELVSTTGTEFADFDFHEVGTSSQAEANTDTALITTTSIARATGTPTDADPIYRSVATITADTTETWQEHGIFNNSSGVALMDRSLTGGQSVVNLDQVQYTYELTCAAEA